jgi:hypothetical protein
VLLPNNQFRLVTCKRGRRVMGQSAVRADSSRRLLISLPLSHAHIIWIVSLSLLAPGGKARIGPVPKGGLSPCDGWRRERAWVVAGLFRCVTISLMELGLDEEERACPFTISVV